MAEQTKVNLSDAVAIIGMTGRFPGAETVRELWTNLRAGVESIRFFSDDELLAAGVHADLVSRPDYVKAAARLTNADMFAADFFGVSRKEAELTDPQHRVFMECAWEALEDAGYVPDRHESRIGVFAGAGLNPHTLNSAGLDEYLQTMGMLPVLIGNKADFMTTKVSYKLNLKGPSLNVNTACSTSLVAVHLACRSLLNYECDMALAGGVTIGNSTAHGYLYQPGGVTSPDGHCRAFSAQAMGTVGAHGAGIVVLKRLEEALDDADHIYAVIRGSAINNDGGLKVGYTAPGVDGQVEVVATAIAMADVEPSTIGYVEAHGTGTMLGDPIEVDALTQAFRMGTDAIGICALGSVKTNIGHLDAAAGIAGLIKATLCLQHQELVPSLHCDQPNPAINFQDSPFYVNTTLRQWLPPSAEAPLRAGVSAFGIGGTNAHVVLEQAPARQASAGGRQWQLLLLSAQTEATLEAASANLARHVVRPDAGTLGDIAYTLQVGRRGFEQRRYVLASSHAEAAEALMQQPENGNAYHISQYDSAKGGVVFMFPGIGEQYAQMGAELYHREPVYRKHIDQCALLLLPRLGIDVRILLGAHMTDAPALLGTAAEAPQLDLRRLLSRLPPSDEQPLTDALQQTRYAHPVLFVVEYALAQLYIDLGVPPAAMIGHSLGEYVAACIAGVMTLEQALMVVAERARLIDELPAGRMLAVALPEQALRSVLSDGLSLAAINSRTMTVVSGPSELITGVEQYLGSRGIAYLPVQCSHAFHSTMMAPAAKAIHGLLSSFELKPPLIPYISNVTGTWITAAEATAPDYWVRHTCQTVRFDDGIETLFATDATVFIEMGPGQALSSFVQQHPACRQRQEFRTLPSLPGRQDKVTAEFVLARTLGTLWCSGFEIDWARYRRADSCGRVPLPTYPFERQRYALPTAPHATLQPIAGAEANCKQKLSAPAWIADRTLPPPAEAGLAVNSQENWLILGEASTLAAALQEALVARGRRVSMAHPGAASEHQTEARTDGASELYRYGTLMAELKASGMTPQHVVELRTLAAVDHSTSAAAYTGLLRAAQSLDVTTPVQFVVLTNQALMVTGDEIVCPEAAILAGPCAALPLALPHVRCCHMDVHLPPDQIATTLLAQRIAHELTQGLPAERVALRGALRWVCTDQSIQPAVAGRLRPNGGTHLITGYTGTGLPHAVADFLVTLKATRIVLVPSLPLPPAKDRAASLVAAETAPSVLKILHGIAEIERAGIEVLIVDMAHYQNSTGAFRYIGSQVGRLDTIIHCVRPLPNRGLDGQRDQLLPAASLELQKVAELSTAMKQGASDLLVLLTAGAGDAARSLENASVTSFVRACSDHICTASGGAAIAAHIRWQDTQEAVIAREDATFDNAIRAAVGDALAAVMSARTCHVEVTLANLPYTVPAGHATSATTAPRHGSRPPYLEPETDIALRVAELWENLLGASIIGMSDNFFSLGGNSLLGVQFTARVREAFHIDLPLNLLFRSATLRDVSAAIEDILIGEIENMGSNGTVSGGREDNASDSAWINVAPTRHELPNGMHVEHFNTVETDHFYHDIFDERVYYRNGITLHDNAVIFDVGANIGLFSLFAQRQCANPTIFAFEPAPPVFEVLARNLNAHGVNARLFNCGLADKARQQQLTFYPRSTGMSSFLANEDEERQVLLAIMNNQLANGMQDMEDVILHADDILQERFRSQTYDCLLLPLSEIIKEHKVQQIDLLKVDVQKSELDVLHGIAEHDWPLIRQVVIEVHDLDHRVAVISAILERHGFDVSVVQELLYNQSNISNVYGVRRAARHLNA